MARRCTYEWLSLCVLLTYFAGFSQALQFTSQPQDTEVEDGAENVVLKCQVDDKSVRPSWYKDDVAITEDFNKYTFATSGLNIKPVLKSDAGKYYCKAGGKTSRVATLTVKYICKDDFPIKSSGLVFRGDNASLTCDCSAVPTPSYTWKKDGTVLSFTGKKLVITNAQVGRDEGSYTCAVNSSGKTVQSLPHNLDVQDCSPARVTNPPPKKIPFAVSKPLTIRCDATGDPKPVINWYHKSNTPMKNTTRSQIFSNGALHFTKMQEDDDGTYECVASNICVNSPTYGTELVLAKIGKFSPVEDILGRVGAPVTIRCEPPRKSLPAINNVTWELGDGNPLPNDPRFIVNGNTLRIEKTQRSDTGTYKCVAENLAGRKSIDIKVIIALYPQAIQDPVNTNVSEGKSVKLKCKFSGDPSPTIMWEKDEKTLKNDTNTKIIQSGDGSVLHISNAVSEQSGRYRCVATLMHITERTNEAILFVKEKVVLEKVGSAKFDVGKNAKLKCKILAGTGPFQYRWTKDSLGDLLPKMEVEDSRLIINNVTFTDSGNYTCYISNSFSSASLTFSINIYAFAKINLRPTNVTTKENGTALFDCKATGIPEPQILWFTSKVDNHKFKKAVKLSNNSRIESLPNNSLLVLNVRKEDEGWYWCIAGNRGNIEQKNAYLKVRLDNLKTTPGVSKPNEHDDHSDNMGPTVGIAVGCAGAYIILVVGLMIYCKGRRARQAKNKLIVNGEDMPLKEENADNVETVKAPDAVTDAKEYPRENLEALRTLGNGTYGNVFLAKASEISEGESSSVVVVQSLASDDEAVKNDFMRIMSMLSLKHENIAKLLGVCRDEDPMYLISEYPEQGDLKTVMRDSSTPLTPTQKLNICAAVASGMNYLSNHGHVHKDLAARNCLVDKLFHVKISFLSLNQGTYPKEYYKHNGKLIPLRWLAPEAMEGDYTDMSDVWAFGILMWEVYSEGILPYEERPDEEVLHSVPDDLRLTKPEGCPGKIYKMMEKCWADDKKDRLTFGELCEDLSEIPRESEF